jgi:hypothetical protein
MTLGQPLCGGMLQPAVPHREPVAALRAPGIRKVQSRRHLRTLARRHYTRSVPSPLLSLTVAPP